MEKKQTAYTRKLTIANREIARLQCEAYNYYRMCRIRRAKIVGLMRVVFALKISVAVAAMFSAFALAFAAVCAFTIQ